MAEPDRSERGGARVTGRGPRPLHVGLTGGIAAGKSTVAQRLVRHGAVLVDADAIARELQRPGAAGYERIRDHFGAEVLDPDTGELDRAELARRVFSDPDQLATLNAIMHPLVRERADQLVAAAGAHAVLIHDIPLLVETGRAGEMDTVLVVEAPLEQRIARMVADRGMSEEQALDRIRAQASDAQRRAVADTVFDNSATRAALLAQVDAWWEQHVDSGG